MCSRRGERTCNGVSKCRFPPYHARRGWEKCARCMQWRAWATLCLCSCGFNHAPPLHGLKEAMKACN